MAASSSPLHSAANDPSRFEGLLSRVVIEATQAVCVCDADDTGPRRIVFVNPEFERLTLWSKAEAVGQVLSSLLPPPGTESDGSELERAMHGKQAWRKALPAARKDGTVFWADVHLYPLLGADGITDNWVSLITDVTEHLELHDALRQSESQHRFLSENIRDLVTVCRADGTCVFVSTSCRSMLGYEPEEVIGHPLNFFLHPDDRAQAALAFAGHFESRTESVLVHRLRGKDGNYLWTETNSKTRRDPVSQIPAEIVSTTRDITKRRRAEDSLKSMHKLLDSVYDAVPIGLCLVDGSGQILQCNQAFARFFALDPSAVAGQAADLLLPAKELARASLAQGTGYECECRNARGEIVSAELAVVTLDQAFGANQLVILTDLGERKKMESRLREASQLESLGTLAGGIAHDFNNMLAIILGYASLLRDSADDPARITHYADTIMDAGKRGAEVVRQLQLFANTQDTELAVNNIHDLLDDIIGRLCAGWPENIKVVRNYGARDAILTADPIQLAQALQKLFENARDAMPSGGTATIRTSEVRQAVFSPGSNGEPIHFLRLSVEDSGAGMDAETRSRMFQPFFARHKSGENRGLGLAVVYGIMRAHRGLIEVDSTPGEGTSVHLLFPRATTISGSTPPMTGEPTRAETDRRAVLLVEDEQDIGALWLEVLPSEGWRVLWARDGGEALRLFRAHRDEIALVFTDIGLPVMDGWQVATAVRAEMPHMPLLIASGAFRAGDKQRGFAEPVAYLSKPYVLTAVVKQIHALLPS